MNKNLDSRPWKLCGEASNFFFSGGQVLLLGQRRSPHRNHEKTMKNAHLWSTLQCFAAAGLLCLFFGSTLNASEASRSQTTKQGISPGATATTLGIRNGLRLRGGISRVSDSFHGLPMCVSPRAGCTDKISLRLLVGVASPSQHGDV